MFSGRKHSIPAHSARRSKGWWRVHDGITLSEAFSNFPLNFLALGPPLLNFRPGAGKGRVGKVHRSHNWRRFGIDRRLWIRLGPFLWPGYDHLPRTLNRLEMVVHVYGPVRAATQTPNPKPISVTGARRGASNTVLTFPVSVQRHKPPYGCRTPIPTLRPQVKNPNQKTPISSTYVSTPTPTRNAFVVRFL